MPDTTVTTLQLSFLTATGTPYTMSLRYPKDDLVTLDIETVMDLLITKDIVQTSGGSLATKKDGGIIVRSFTDMVD
jgi:hypothetical protein